MSSPRVGWATTSARGCRASARASSTFCMLPPESDETGSVGRARIANRSISRSACARIAARSSRPRRLNESRSSSTRFCSTLSDATTLPLRSSVSRPRPAARRAATGASVMSVSPTRIRPALAGRVPASDVHQLGLPVAADPGDPDDLPGPHASGSGRRARTCRLRVTRDAGQLQHHGLVAGRPVGCRVRRGASGRQPHRSGRLLVGRPSGRPTPSSARPAPRPGPRT